MISTSIQPADAPAPSAAIEPVIEPNAATIGIIRTCGTSSTPVLTFGTVGFGLAILSVVALVITRRVDVARWAGMANLFLAAAVVLLSSHAGASCVVLGMMTASLPFLVAVASFGVSVARARNKAGPEADSG